MSDGSKLDTGAMQPLGAGDRMERAAFLWLGFAIILMPSLRSVTGMLGASFVGMKSLVGLAEITFAIMLFAARGKFTGLPPVPKAIKMIFWLWVLWSLITIPQVANPSLAVLRTAEWMGHILVLNGLASVFARNPDWMEDFIQIVLLSYLLSCLLIGITWFQLEDPRNHSWVNGFPGFSHARLFGHFAAISLILSMCAMTASSRTVAAGKRVFYFFCSSLAWAGLFWAGGRGPLASVLLTLPLLLIYRKNFRWWMVFLRWFLLSALVGAALSQIFVVNDPSMGLIRLIERSHEFESADDFSSLRLTLWLGALEHFVQDPWLGAGPDGYYYLARGTVFEFTVQPHNIVIQALLEWGLPGAVLFFALLVYMFLAILVHQFKRNDSYGGLRLVALWAIGCICVMSLVSGPLYHTWTTCLFAALVSIAWQGKLTPSRLANNRKQNPRMIIPAVCIALGLVFTANWLSFAVLFSDRTRVDVHSRNFQLLRLFPTAMASVYALPLVDQWIVSSKIDQPKRCELFSWAERLAGGAPRSYAQTRDDILRQAACRSGSSADVLLPDSF